MAALERVERGAEARAAHEQVPALGSCAEAQGVERDSAEQVCSRRVELLMDLASVGDRRAEMRFAIGERDTEGLLQQQGASRALLGGGHDVSIRAHSHTRREELGDAVRGRVGRGLNQNAVRHEGCDGSAADEVFMTEEGARLELRERGRCSDFRVGE